jgi:hypothetical protein
MAGYPFFFFWGTLPSLPLTLPIGKEMVERLCSYRFGGEQTYHICLGVSPSNFFMWVRDTFPS